MANTINVSSVFIGVSECDPIELMKSDDDTRRLVFLPIIHDNAKKNGSVKGSFVYQRKRKADEWEKVTNSAESLSKLKAGEGYRLDLSTDSVTKLVSGLMDINEISDFVKRGRTNTTFVPSARELAPILEQLLNSLDDNALLDELFKLSKDNALRFNDLVLNARIRSALAYWEAHKTDANEENWQKFFSGRPWILSLVCAEPIIIYQTKMFTGGTNASGSGGKTVDFGLINKQTTNTALLEIKTPVTPLLASAYRSIHPPSTQLTGSVTQVQNYKYNLLKHLTTLQDGLKPFDAVNVATYVVAGDCSTLNSAIEKRSYELYRRNLSGTVVLTYDEVFERLRILLNR
jgi:hypothetical protein